MHANSNLPGRKGGELYVDRGHPSVDPGIKLEGSFMSIQSPSKLIFPWKEASCLLQYVPIAGCVKSGKVVFPGHTWRTITLSTVMWQSCDRHVTVMWRSCTRHVALMCQSCEGHVTVMWLLWWPTFQKLFSVLTCPTMGWPLALVTKMPNSMPLSYGG